MAKDIHGDTIVPIMLAGKSYEILVQYSKRSWVSLPLSLLWKYRMVSGLSN